LARGGPRRSPELRRLDQRHALVEARVVLDAGVNVRDARQRGHGTDLSAGDDDGEAVEHEAIAPANLRRGDSQRNLVLDSGLVGLERMEVTGALSCPSSHRDRERGPLQLDDDFDSFRAGRGRAWAAGAGERARDAQRRKQRKTPHQGQKRSRRLYASSWPVWASSALRGATGKARGRAS